MVFIRENIDICFRRQYHGYNIANLNL